MILTVDTEKKEIKVEQATFYELQSFVKNNSYSQYSIVSTNKPETMVFQVPEDATKITTIQPQ